MKRVLFLMLGLLLLVAVTSPALAENSLEAGSKALVFSTSSDVNITGKYFLASDMAVMATVGFLNAGVSGAKTTTLGLAAGVAKYLKTDDVSPYVGAGVRLDRVSMAAGATSTFTLGGVAGVEAFMAKSVSLSGEVAFQFGSTSPPVGDSSSSIGTLMSAIQVNLYLP